MGRVIAALFTLLGFASTAAAAEVELKNDGFTTGMSVAFQGGFAPGDMGAVRLEPPTAGQLLRIRFLFGGATTQQTITLRIYNDVGGMAPGSEIYNGDYMVTGANDAFSEIDLSGENVLVTGPFRVAIEFHHMGVPAIARDDDGVFTKTHNFVYDTTWGWQQSDFFSVENDWIIRAFVETGGGGPDAGPLPDATPAPDAAPYPDATTAGPDAGQACQLNSDCPNGSYCGDDNTCTFDCRLDIDCPSGNTCDPVGRCVPGDDGGGCGCRGGGDAGGVLLLGLMLLALGRRRLRRVAW